MKNTKLVILLPVLLMIIGTPVSYASEDANDVTDMDTSSSSSSSSSSVQTSPNRGIQRDVFNLQNEINSFTKLQVQSPSSEINIEATRALKRISLEIRDRLDSIRLNTGLIWNFRSHLRAMEDAREETSADEWVAQIKLKFEQDKASLPNLISQAQGLMELVNTDEDQQRVTTFLQHLTEFSTTFNALTLDDLAK